MAWELVEGEMDQACQQIAGQKPHGIEHLPARLPQRSLPKFVRRRGENGEVVPCITAVPSPRTSHTEVVNSGKRAR